MDQIYFKDIALDFLKENGFEPVLVKSEEAQILRYRRLSKQVPYLFLKLILLAKRLMRFYTEKIVILINMIL